MPNGVVFHNGALYVAEVSRILRYDNIEAHQAAPPAPVVLTDNYPRDTHHGWKSIRLGPDGLLYVSVGAPCNICQRPDERYASAEGWLQGEEAWGRPVDVQVMPDGALLVSDDYAGAISRISYQQ